MSSFMKILLLGAELFNVDRQTDGQTDLTKLLLFCEIIRTRLKL